MLSPVSRKMTVEEILERFSMTGKEAKKVTDTVERIRRVYMADGLTKEDIPGILAELMSLSASLKKGAKGAMTLDGPAKKKLVTHLLFYLIEEIDSGDEDTEREIVLKNMVGPMIDGMAMLLKVKNMCRCFGK